MLDAGFEGRDAVLACREVIWFTMAFVSNEIRNEVAAEAAGGSRSSALGSFEHVSAASETEFPELVRHLPYFAETNVEEVFALTAGHILAGLAAKLEAEGEGTPGPRSAKSAD